MQATVVKNPGHWVITGCKGMSYPEFCSVVRQILSDRDCPSELTIEGLRVTAAELGSAGRHGIWEAVT